MPNHCSTKLPPSVLVSKNKAKFKHNQFSLGSSSVFLKFTKWSTRWPTHLQSPLPTPPCFIVVERFELLYKGRNVTRTAEIKKSAGEDNGRQPQKVPTVSCDKPNSFISTWSSTLWAGFSVQRSFSGSDYRAPNSLTDGFKWIWSPIVKGRPAWKLNGWVGEVERLTLQPATWI